MSSKAKFCTECGNPLLDDDKFCSHCGKPVPSNTEGTTSEIDNSSDELSQDALAALASLDETDPQDPKQEDSEQDNQKTQPEDSDSLADEKTERIDTSLNDEKTHIFDAVPLSAAQYPAPAASQQVGSQNPTKEFPAVSNPPAPQGQPVNAAQGQPVSGAQVYRAAPPQPKQGLSKQQLGIIIGAAAVVVIGIIVAVVLFLTSGNNSEQETTQNTQTTTEATAPDQSNGQETAESTVPTSAADRAIYNRLSTFYDRLGSYDNEIANAATVFNNTYTTKSMSKRDEARDDAYDILNDITDEMSDLQSLSVPSSSEYYDSYNDISTCYYDCYMRISVIVDAWDISLRYSNPADHTDEITAPIARDNVNGKNRYLTEFDSLYESARPASPRN